MTERQARLAPPTLYLGPDGRLHLVAGIAHLEDAEGRVVIETTSQPLVLVRAALRGQDR